MRDATRECPSRTGQRSPKTDCGSGKSEGGFEPFITKDEVAKRMDVEIRTVTRLMVRGVIRYYKVGPLVRFKWSEVECDLREHLGVGFEPSRESSPAPFGGRAR